MSYGLDLVRLPSGEDPTEAYKKLAAAKESQMAAGPPPPGPADPRKEQAKQRLAAALRARHPSLELAQPNYAARAKLHSISVEEARERFRYLELNDTPHGIQVLLFDDAAGASFSFGGPPDECRQALQLLWDCLLILTREGGFSVYDTQLGKVLDLDADMPLVLENACGIRSK
jgi:hypothetical protein